MKQRRCAKAHVGETSKPERGVLRTIAGFKRFQMRSRRIGLDLGEDAPRRRQSVASLQAGRTCESQRTIEAWCAVIEVEHAIEIDGQRLFAGVDSETNTRAVAVTDRPRG